VERNPSECVDACRRVLVVDDDADFAGSLVELIELQGWEAVAAGSPDEARAVLDAATTPVVMLDVRLGLASGVDLLSELSERHPRVVFVMMTAQADTESAVAALRRGAYDYYQKAAGPRELAAILNRCFEKFDLQEQKRAANEALWRAKELAEQANRAKSEFLANMSHELRTPLNAVIGFSELMLNGIHGALDQRYQAYVQDIHTSGRHLLDIINDILDLAKAEAGQLELNETAVDAAEVLARACRLIDPQARKAGVAVALAAEPNLPRLLCDERRLCETVLNLLSNAVKFTPPGGSVEVGAAVEPGAGMVIAVRDTGIGMAAGDIPKALQPFVQLSSTFNRNHQGTGLGLPLVTAMMDLHGGGVAIESEPGKGTVVRVSFPAGRIVEEACAAGA
jgi:signal transduction histidine kinase